MEDIEKNDEKIDSDSKFREEIFSKSVRAGKRTYFFDVKSTRKDEFYLTITESKKRFELDGNFHFEKHKIFLYKEDFEKFIEGMQEAISYIDHNQTESDLPIAAEKSTIIDLPEELEMAEMVLEKDYTQIEFDDLSN